MTDLKNEITKSSIESSNLPSTWALLFFASLFVFVAHLVYQISAPELIKEKSIEDYIAAKKEEYSKNPNEKALEYSQNYIEHFNYPWIEVADKPDHDMLQERREYEDKVRRWELDVIEAGSQSLYLYQSERNLPAIIGSGLAYIIGISMILWVVVEQSWSVAVATGWVSG